MSKDIKKALEHCVEWNCADCPNREELGSGETVCRGRLLPDILEYVADLEAKLAESEEQCRDCKHLNKKIELNIKNKLMAENCELQKQLAEKEKEVKELICDYESRITKEQELMSWLEHKVEESDQAKTDFAIEQLEKVYEYTADVWWVDGVSEVVCNFIDQQIKELKEKTNVKD